MAGARAGAEIISVPQHCRLELMDREHMRWLSLLASGDVLLTYWLACQFTKAALPGSNPAPSTCGCWFIHIHYMKLMPERGKFLRDFQKYRYTYGI